MKGYVAGFGGLLLLVGAGVDYDSLSRAQGVPLGTVSAVDYATYIPARISDYRAKAAAAQALAELQAVPPVDHLGAAPGGWERRAWTADDEAALHGLTPDDYAAWKKSLKKGAFATGAAAQMTPTEIKRRERQAVTYLSGAQIVEVTATFKPAGPSDAPVAGVTQAQINDITVQLKTHNKKLGFGFVDGVVYIEDRTDWKPGDSVETVPFITVWATLGDQIALHIRARATDDAVRQVITTFDHDALNAMLQAPFADVGSQNPALDVAGQIKLANLHLAAEQARNVSILADYKAQMDKTGKVSAPAPQPRTTAMDDAMRAEFQTQLAARREAMPAPSDATTAARADSSGTAARDPTDVAKTTQRRPVETAAGLANKDCRVENGTKRCRVGN